MRNLRWLATALLLGLLVLDALGVDRALSAPAAATFNSSQTFNYTGSAQAFTVPDGVSSVQIVARGGQGGTSGAVSGSAFTGGSGAEIQGDFSVAPGEQLTILVGGSGGQELVSGGRAGAVPSFGVAPGRRHSTICRPT
jgi:hypothetical protein